MPIVYDDNFKIIVGSFIKSGLNMMVLYVSMCVSTSVGPLKSVSRGNNSLWSDDLLQLINDTMFDNPFADQYKFNYSKSSENENDEMLNLNMIVNINDDVDDGIINHVYEFGDASRSSFVVSHD